MTLTSNPEFTIYDELGQDGSLIRIAGTTCYRSEETTKLDADGFIRMLKKNNHTAMLEFSWFPVAVSIDGGELLYTTFLSSHKFFEYSVINGVAYISGNGRAWYNYLKDRKYMASKITTISIIVEKIAALLKEINPVLFDFTIDEHLIASDKFNRVKVSNASMDILEIKELHDKHRWFMVKYFNVSRGFCYDDQTEVLTRSGWKLFKDTTDDDEFFTIDMETKNTAYQKRTAYTIEPWDDDLIYGESSMVNFAVTPNHNMLWYHYDSRNNKQWFIDKASVVYGRRVKFQRGLFNYYNGDFSYTEEFPQQFTENFAKFMGIWITDGSLNKSDTSGGRVTITQTKAKGKKYIQNVLDDLGWEYKVNGAGFRINNTQLYNFLRKYFPKKFKKTYIGAIPEWIRMSNREYIRAFLEGAIMGDGNIHKINNHVVIYTANKEMAGNYQELFMKAGFCASIREDNRIGYAHEVNGKIIENKVVQYIVSVTQRTNEHLFNKEHWSKKHYKGNVYCVTVPNGTLYVRRNGKSFWSCNTHETVRHRVMSFAQASTRYIKNENFEHIAFPPDTQVSDEIMQKYIAWVEYTKEMYSMLKSNGFKNDIARQVLPIGIANEICVAGTLEKWKGVFELRTKSDAHWEIRNIMSSTELAIKELI